MRRRQLPIRRVLNFFGEVAEWSNAPDSKSGIRVSRIEGSNPSLSARYAKSARRALFAYLAERQGRTGPFGPPEGWAPSESRSGDASPPQAFNRQPARKIHHTPVRHKPRNTSVAT